MGDNYSEENAGKAIQMDIPETPKKYK